MDPKKYAQNLSKAVRFSATHEGLPALLSTLTDADRWGTVGADHTKRGIIADYIDDLGSERPGGEQEAAHLRSGRHVLIQDGKVVPARWTIKPLHDFRQQVGQLMMNAGGWREAHGNTGVYGNRPLGLEPDDFLPSAVFRSNVEDPDEDPDNGELWDTHVQDIKKHLIDHSTGLPVVQGDTFTCHDFECPVHEAAKEYSDLLLDTVFDRRNNVLDHLEHGTWRQLRAEVRSRAKNLNLEEPDPTAES